MAVAERNPPPPPEIQIKVHSWRTGITVHPVEGASASASATPFASTEIKHFKKWVPWLIPSFVVANVVMFFITMFVNDCPNYSFGCIPHRFLGRFSFQPFKENPLLGPSALTLARMGALDVHRITYEHQGWRLLTCIWLHSGLFHLLANMLSLLVIGIRLEQEFGFARIGFLYLISGLCGSILSALFVQQNISVGASGAVFGLLGGMLSELITNWTIYANKVVSLIALVVIVAINLAVGILPHVDNFAHIGGFLSGFLLGFVFLIRPQYIWVSQRYASHVYSSSSRSPKFNACQCILWVVSLILLIVGFTVGLVLLLRGVDLNKQCSWCHYLTCVPTSKWSCKAKSTASCLMERSGDQITLTCSGRSRSHTYTLPNADFHKIGDLCTQLCS